MVVLTMNCEKCNTRFHYEYGQTKVRCPRCGYVQSAAEQQKEQIRCQGQQQIQTR